MEYTNVKSAHIVPRVYLANFALDAKIGTRLVDNPGEELVLPIENVGTRRRYYRRERPDGSVIDDIEDSLGKGENAATPILGRFDSTWPLSFEERACLAELFGYQILRGPRFEAEHGNFVDKAIDDFKREHDVSPEEEAHARELLGGKTYRFIQMLRLGPLAGSVLASMHWTLVEFDSPLLATSDHPVLPWPGGDVRAPGPTDILAAGLCECIEVRLPLSPTRAVLMTWADKPDDDETVVHGDPHHAYNLNAFTIASADKQWFHYPGKKQPRGSGKLPPLSTQLVSGYTPLAANHSRRRARTEQDAKSMRGRDLSERDLRIVTMSGVGPKPGL